MKTDDLHVLDNPLWCSLTTIHKQYACGHGTVLRAAPEVLPYFAMENPAKDQLSRIIPWLSAGEHLSILGSAPDVIPEGLTLDYKLDLYQMIADRNELSPQDQDAGMQQTYDGDEILAMKKDVGTGYFQPGTIKLGRFFGFRENNELIAVAGERLKLPGFTEISTVYTNPEYRGKGYASKLVTHIHNLNLKEGNRSFLQVAKTNVAAIKLYEKLGFRIRTTFSVHSFSLAAT